MNGWENREDRVQASLMRTLVLNDDCLSIREYILVDLA